MAVSCDAAGAWESVVAKCLQPEDALCSCSRFSFYYLRPEMIAMCEWTCNREDSQVRRIWIFR